MALDEYVAEVILQVDGQDVECQSFTVRESTGRRPVKTMNRLRRIAGITKGIVTYDITITVVIPANGDPIDWSNIEGAKLTSQGVQGGKRTSYLGFCVQETGETYQTDGGEAHKNLTGFAVRKVTE